MDSPHLSRKSKCTTVLFGIGYWRKYGTFQICVLCDASVQFDRSTFSSVHWLWLIYEAWEPCLITTKKIFKVKLEHDGFRSIFLHVGSNRFIFGNYNNNLDFVGLLSMLTLLFTLCTFWLMFCCYVQEDLWLSAFPIGTEVCSHRLLLFVVVCMLVIHIWT